ncbi:MAG: ribonuclease VapC [Euryarchaeota archaeon]|nr:ribonuclease VapC [Euryarchaeota archaeon]
MSDKIYVLDASAFIGGFYSKKVSNFTTSDVILEIKDIKSKLFLQSAIEDGFIEIREPDPQDLRKVEEVIMSSGDILRLSEVDKRIVALALTLKKDNFDPIVVTDDYSIQNVLKIMKISYKSILTPGIKALVGWIKVCKGCKQKYPSDSSLEECEICGSPVFRKRIKVNKKMNKNR